MGACNAVVLLCSSEAIIYKANRTRELSLLLLKALSFKAAQDLDCASTCALHNRLQFISLVSRRPLPQTSPTILPSCLVGTDNTVHGLLAGLCHDLGHGPFSHVFEHELLPRVVGKEEAKQW